jgi:hypothetical protein
MHSDDAVTAVGMLIVCSVLFVSVHSSTPTGEERNSQTLVEQPPLALAEASFALPQPQPSPCRTRGAR